MGGRSGGVEGADHTGAAESVVHGSSLSSDWASGPEVSARLGPALCPWSGGEGVSVSCCGSSYMGWTLTPAGLEARGPWVLLLLPWLPHHPGADPHTGPVVPTGLASLSLGGWKDKGCSFFLFSFSGAYGTSIHTDAQNQRLGRYSHLHSSVAFGTLFSKHLPALGNSAPLSAHLTIT